jgi:HJR/Mrr/RecB family endonuclease
MPERTKPLRPQPSERADRLVGWLASKSLRWYYAFAALGALLAIVVALPQQPSWHELLAWVLVGISVPIMFLAITVATVSRDRNLIAEAHSLADLRALSWTHFEEFVAGLFRARRWRVVQTQREGDGGADLIVAKKRETAYVQCKQWRGQVSVETVRAFYGAMAANRTKQGYFVTTGEFTPEAERFAQSVGVQLIGGSALVRHLRTIQRQTAKSGIN